MFFGRRRKIRDAIGSRWPVKGDKDPYADIPVELESFPATIRGYYRDFTCDSIEGEF